MPFGLAIGIAVGMLGGGGSVLAVPILVYILGQSVSEATTASLVVVTAGALAGGLGHARAGRVCWRHAGSFTLAAIPGLVAGTLAGASVSGSALLGTFALIMLAAAAATWRKAGEQQPIHGTWERGGTCPPLRMPRDVLAGVLVGFLTGFFGVGGGFLIVPTLAIALAFTMRTAVGTSLAIITATSSIGLVVHLLAGRGLDLAVTTTMTVACVAGALLGAAAATRVPQRDLGRAFALLVCGVAAYLLVSATLLGGPPRS
ncbi:MAG: sulfite exporter TauE/SafE family protein [Solirubrobacteraceae bacterium]